MDGRATEANMRRLAADMEKFNLRATIFLSDYESLAPAFLNFLAIWPVQEAVAEARFQSYLP